LLVLRVQRLTLCRAGHERLEQPRRRRRPVPPAVIAPVVEADGDEEGGGYGQPQLAFFLSAFFTSS
jgi:hypothetical protein